MTKDAFLELFPEFDVKSFDDSAFNRVNKIATCYFSFGSDECGKLKYGLALAHLYWLFCKSDAKAGISAKAPSRLAQSKEAGSVSITYASLQVSNLATGNAVVGDPFWSTSAYGQQLLLLLSNDRIKCFWA